MKKRIKVKFVGFWAGFDERNNFISNILCKYFELEYSEQPEYLFASCFSDEYLHYNNCVRIFYTGENLCPDFNLFDYAIGYEKMAFGDRYLRYPNYAIPEEYGKDVERMLVKHLDVQLSACAKTDFCSFVVSKGSGYVAKEREMFYKQLSFYKKVNSGGRYLNNIGQPEGVCDKLQFQEKHKFAIAFENSFHVGYSTEKIVQAFAAKTVPIYWGDPGIEDEFNGKAFVNCHRFENFGQVIERIEQIDADPEIYQKMLLEPALLKQDTVECYNRALEKFLLHIAEQPLGDAYRRDLVGYNRKHEDRMRYYVMWEMPVKRVIKEKIKGKIKRERRKACGKN